LLVIIKITQILPHKLHGQRTIVKQNRLRCEKTGKGNALITKKGGISIMSKSIFAACLILLFLFSQVSLAEEEQKATIKLEEVVVTATKTEKRLGDVPASVDVITADNLIQYKTFSDDEVKKYNTEHGTDYKTIKQKENVAKAKSQGFEMGVSGKIFKTLLAFANYTYTDTGVYGGYDAFFVVDLKLSYRLDPSAKISFSVDNLFDKEYYQYYKSPGRTLGLHLSKKF